MTGIYKITNNITGNFYIGQSINIEKRFKEHKRKKLKTKLSKDFQKYGLNNFTFEIVEIVSVDKLNEKELFYIENLKPYYNSKKAVVNDCLRNISKDTIAKLKASGKKHWEEKSQEDKEKLIKNNLKGPALNHKVSEETRNKIRKSLLGTKMKDETKQKISNAHKEKFKNGYINKGAILKNQKKVLCVQENKSFNSIKEAAEYYGIDAGSITKVCKGQRKSCKNLIFKYL